MQPYVVVVPRRTPPRCRPAAVPLAGHGALRAWGRGDRPTADRALRGSRRRARAELRRPADAGCRRWCPSTTAGSSQPPSGAVRCVRRHPSPSRAARRHGPRALAAHRRPGPRAARRRAGGRGAPGLAHRAAAGAADPPGRSRRSTVRAGPRGQGAPEEPAPARRRVRPPPPPNCPTSRSCCSVPMGRTSPPSTPPSPASPARPPSGSCWSTTSPTTSATPSSTAPAALAYPSLDEGFGFPALEAMAAGVPVVAADAGSLPEVCGDAAATRRPPRSGRHRGRTRAAPSPTSPLRAELVTLGHERTERFSIAAVGHGDGRARTGALAEEGRRS